MTIPLSGRRHPPDQGFGTVAFGWIGAQVVQVYADRFGVLTGEERNTVITTRGHRCDAVKIDGTGQDPAVVMVGVVTAEFGAAGGTGHKTAAAGQARFGVRQQATVSGLLFRQGCFPIEVGQTLICLAGGERIYEGGNRVVHLCFRSSR